MRLASLRARSVLLSVAGACSISSANVAESDSPRAASTVPAGPSSVTSAASVEQTSPGRRPPAALAASFDGLGEGFLGPQGSAAGRNPSDNSLAVGPDHIVQIVNSRMAICTKRGRRVSESGRAL